MKREPRSIRPAAASFFDTAKMECDRVRQWGQTTMEETVDCTILLERS